MPEEDRPLSDRELAIRAEAGTYVDRSFLNLTHVYNQLSEKSEDLASQTKTLNLKIEAVERLIQEQLDVEGTDSVKINGYTWSPQVEPYPSAEDPEAIVKYFKDHEMEDQLRLNKTELASRLKTFVKEEALNNELVIEATSVVDPVTGEERVVTEVRSHIPGVKVYLKTSLSRRKSSNK